MTDGHGRPLVLRLTAGNVNDIKVAKLCLGSVPPVKRVLGDKGYDSNELRQWLIDRQTIPVIPPRKNRKLRIDYDKVAYKSRNVAMSLSVCFAD